ncbi:porin [Klebsiella pneumoniae]|uniref:Porin n=1 Tax=Klebsiella pneumoniae TaxID=573 RepID=A0A2X3DC36_KLEPN|nr:porin [Klebsiella pneumoniae]
MAATRNQGGVGDGGNTIWLANSYWSDFNGEDERSWQASYGLDFAGLGVPGLSWTTAYVRGDNIKTAETSNGKEHEWFNQVQYQVQNGMAKDLKLRLRYSVLRVSSNASDYNVSGNEVRFYVEYPFNVF